MKKVILVLTCIVLFASSCSHEATFKSDSGPVIATGYGIANEDAKKLPNVVYSISASNVFWAIIFSETIIVPIYVVGWELYKPEKLKS